MVTDGNGDAEPDGGQQNANHVPALSLAKLFCRVVLSAGDSLKEWVSHCVELSVV